MNPKLWAAAAIALQILQGVVFEQTRVNPSQDVASEARLTLAEAWEWKEKFCPEPAVTLSAWSPEAALACVPPGALCGWNSDCCSGSCSAWRCE